MAAAVEGFVKLSSLIVAGLIGLSALSLADQNNIGKSQWMVRIRAMSLTPANDSGAFTALGTNFPANAVNLSNKVFPEVDATYFFTKNWALELILTYPQQHDVSLTGAGNIGTVTHLPPVLSAQYHWPNDKCPVEPYVGLGINYTIITDSNLSAGGTPLDVTKSSVGLAYGAGLDYKLNERWSLNLDYKHVYIRTNVKAGGAILTNADINPNLVSFGIGYHF